ncbi:MAG: AmmeMemoRadiSam system protein B [Thermoanaerobaculales bacterium]|nr:AmmeMemoRadiSam system protein B [Thermoanaerobaculales bacterium]
MEIDFREPVVAGTFYPRGAAALEEDLRRLIDLQPVRHRLLACISPHAGYVYSGGVAGKLYGHLDVPRIVIVLGPNHTGAGAAVAVAPHERWRTPLGDLPIATSLGRRLVDRAPLATFDPRAHWREHSLEVQLPFLLARRPDLEMLPICLGHLRLDDCLDLGRILARIVSDSAEPVGIVASSDMSHYLPEEEANRLDHLAIDAALTRDPAKLYETVHRHGITMCGVVPATVALAAANELGAVGGHLVAYTTSGAVSGDHSAVVGYAGMCFHR